jgi:hypothetical protein
MTRDAAKQALEDYLRSLHSAPDEAVVILDEFTIEKPYGWIFFYQTKLYIETGNVSYALAGNGPVVVRAGTHEIETLSTAISTERAVAEFERQNGLEG